MVMLTKLREMGEIAGDHAGQGREGPGAGVG